RNSNGEVAIWSMNGTQVSASTYLGVAGSQSWSIVDGHADYDSGGKSDILWRNSDGTVATWLMNGAQITASSYLGVLAQSWSTTTELGATLGGDNADNTLQGTIARDTIKGALGNDTLSGAAGAD